MKTTQLIGILITLVSFLFIFLTRFLILDAISNLLLLILFNYLLTLFLPGLIIGATNSWLTQGEGDLSELCGGLKGAGYFIGLTERSLIYLAFMIAYFDSTISFVSVLSFLSVVIAGKAIFRYSSREVESSKTRKCADWYILGTFMSITMALANTWFGFRFLLFG